MYDYHDYSGMTAGFLAFVAYILYILDIIKNPEKKKSLTGWIIWTIIGVIIFRSFILVGAGQNDASSWVPLVYAVGPPVILFVLIFKYRSREAQFSLLDKIFLVASLASGVYLWYFREGMLPLHINMVIDGIGAVYIAANAWHDPKAESRWAWTFFAIGTIVNLFAIRQWEYANYVYPISITVMCVVIAILTWRKK